MFITDPTIVDLKIREKNLYKAIFSMNFHQVATPELGVDDARCYIFFFREGDKLSAYIVLYMPSTGRCLYYTYSANPFPEADLPVVEDVARAFGEEMGFFLDEKLFASSSAAEKNLWIDEQPLFGIKTPDELAPIEIIVPPGPAAQQAPIPVLAVDVHASSVAPSPSVAQPTPLAPDFHPAPGAAPVYQQEPTQPVPTAPSAAPGYYQPTPAAPVYYQPAPPAPAAQPMPPAAPVYYQPAPLAPTAQTTPAPPQYYQPAPPAPTAQTTPAAPQYYQPAPPAPAAPQMSPQPIYQQDTEVESQVEVDGEEEVDVRPPRQKNTAASRATADNAKTGGAVPRTAHNPHEGEHRSAPKNQPPAPKQPPKKEMRVAIGVVGRELEALARLMASF